MAMFLHKSAGDQGNLDNTRKAAAAVVAERWAAQIRKLAESDARAGEAEATLKDIAALIPSSYPCDIPLRMRVVALAAAAAKGEAETSRLRAELQQAASAQEAAEAALAAAEEAAVAAAAAAAEKDVPSWLRGAEAMLNGSAGDGGGRELWAAAVISRLARRWLSGFRRRLARALVEAKLRIAELEFEADEARGAARKLAGDVSGRESGQSTPKRRGRSSRGSQAKSGN
ncbi:hypothetical protein EMIHUDRAFT_447064 [Emiliania huxleyi CCMP1516]|uniref:Uncharacterized protein n=2 Tax=Emiliania huxleyi TaxID=2903 RepID=A0A0D3JF77_EMIH1|nr:hypothetical protein EMIHUDRAFT_435581 [Emiliania huxleyi CCMP1516]XP_005787125.1 hypothetical protein EMIHUDRAFT_447064 [Emiliania huxleyi CCMP1516]EOD22162.1 hypothetical protein EMIHUDRAFT_435581 [Emiliania huxleyi CCMP1516]EOD34696.1 hypothetical protein EMIHUDRAFT_447064 [Emiliania huxleyi CCMP1516]|eukprot:XP_005774591.1 hypothetical protein EMIHUDRAFT_435581 [Emiliania huxleyi CCMP1516]